MTALPAPALLADRRGNLPDLQASAPAQAIALGEVGVASMRLPLVLDRGPVVATLRMSVNLGASQRGAHMSRFRRAVDAVPESLEPYEFAKELAAELLRRHEYASSARVTIDTEALIGDLVLPSTAHAVAGDIGRPLPWAGSSVSLQVQGSTVCPCSFAMSGDRYAHVQRAEVRLQVLEPRASTRELHALCSRAFSAPVAMLLDRPSEKALVDRMFAHPRFIEDVTREVVNSLHSERVGRAARVVATAFESIHPYDCYAAWEGTID